ncbi:hypothetical protein [Sorangium sp. So ce861]|uniref:hypothetical protein n=1 Tax=Sorangium sp. So ce861 TaxID=3133323 RepID=UPI003F64145D
MQAQAPCLLIPSSSTEPGTEAGAPEPAASRVDTPAPLAAGPAAEPAVSAAAERAPSAAAGAAAAEPAARAGHPGWTASLLAERQAADLRQDLARFGVGVGLASLYGLALGARQGGASLVQHAAGVPAAMVAVACLGVPALTIVLTLFDAPLDPARALSATARAAAATGLVLGGLAPAAALFVVTSGAHETAAMMGLIGLAVGGVMGVRVLLHDLGAVLRPDRGPLTWSGTTAALLGFAGFAVALALRVWWGTLPILRGGVL